MGESGCASKVLYGYTHVYTQVYVYRSSSLYSACAYCSIFNILDLYGPDGCTLQPRQSGSREGFLADEQLSGLEVLELAHIARLDADVPVLICQMQCACNSPIRLLPCRPSCGRPLREGSTQRSCRQLAPQALLTPRSR